MANFPLLTCFFFFLLIGDTDGHENVITNPELKDGSAYVCIENDSLNQNYLWHTGPRLASGDRPYYRHHVWLPDIATFKNPRGIKTEWEFYAHGGFLSPKDVAYRHGPFVTKNIWYKICYSFYEVEYDKNEVKYDNNDLRKNLRPYRSIPSSVPTN